MSFAESPDGSAAPAAKAAHRPRRARGLPRPRRRRRGWPRRQIPAAAVHYPPILSQLLAPGALRGVDGQPVAQLGPADAVSPRSSSIPTRAVRVRAPSGRSATARVSRPSARVVSRSAWRWPRPCTGPRRCAASAWRRLHTPVPRRVGRPPGPELGGREMPHVAGRRSLANRLEGGWRVLPGAERAHGEPQSHRGNGARAPATTQRRAVHAATSPAPAVIATAMLGEYSVRSATTMPVRTTRLDTGANVSAPKQATKLQGVAAPDMPPGDRQAATTMATPSSTRTGSGWRISRIGRGIVQSRRLGHEHEG